MVYEVTFELKSFYENDTNNMVGIVKKEYDVESLDMVFDILDNTDEIYEIDDSCVLNLEIDDEPIETNIEYVLIHDSAGNEVYRDQDYLN